MRRGPDVASPGSRAKPKREAKTRSQKKSGVPCPRKGVLQALKFKAVPGHLKRSCRPDWRVECCNMQQKSSGVFWFS